MPTRRLVLSIMGGILAMCLTSTPALAATLTASIAVSVTVEAGCQVSPGPVAPKYSIAELATLRTPAPVDCSMTVPYQVVVAVSPRTALPAGNSPSFNVGGIPEYAQSRNVDPLQTRTMPYAVDRIVSSDSGAEGGFSPASFSETRVNSLQAPYRLDSGPLIMTVVF